MPGLLDRFLSSPGQAQALGLLGAQLMAAGAPSTDPGARMKGTGLALQGYLSALREGRQAQEMSQFRDLQKQQLEQQIADKKSAAERRNRQMGLLYGPSGPWRNPDTGQMNEPTGILSKVPEAQRPFLTGLAMDDPKAAMMKALELSTSSAPKTREIKKGGQIVTQEWDGQAWRDVGTAPRFQPTKPSPLQEKISELIKSGVDRNSAIGIATGRLATSRDPISGAAQVIDKASGQVVGKLPKTAQAPEAPASAMPGNVDYDAATGGSGFFGNIANTAAGMAGFEPFPEVEEAGQALTNLGVRTKTALQAGIPGRPSNYLMEQLGELVVEPHSLFRGDPSAKRRFTQTRNMIKTEIARIDRDILGNAGEFSPKQIAEARANRSELTGLLSDYDAVLESKSDQAGGAPEGVDPEDWKYMTPEERQLWQN